MNFRTRGVGRRRVEVTLELTPLIDVVFLLLIFFVVTMTFARNDEAQIPINLPRAASGQAATQPERVVLFVTAEGNVLLDGEVEWQSDDLASRLAELYERTPDASILLRGDTDASHGRVVELLDLVKQTGFERVNLVIARPQ